MAINYKINTPKPKAIRQTIITSCLLFFVLISTAQVGTTIPATVNMGGGSAAVTSNFWVDWSIGEAVSIDTYLITNSLITPIFGSQWTITSGILQPFDKNFILISNPTQSWEKGEVTLYPIPTPNMVYVKFKLYIANLSGTISIQLLTPEGRLLSTKQLAAITGTSTESFNLFGYPAGIYRFRITLTDANSTIIKTSSFKFIKI